MMTTNTARTWDQMVTAIECLPVAVDAALEGNLAQAILVLTEADMSVDCAIALVNASIGEILAKSARRAARIVAAERVSRMLYNVDCYLDEGRTEAAAWARAERDEGYTYEQAQAIVAGLS